MACSLFKETTIHLSDVPLDIICLPACSRYGCIGVCTQSNLLLLWCTCEYQRQVSIYMCKRKAWVTIVVYSGRHQFRVAPQLHNIDVWNKTVVGLDVMGWPLVFSLLCNKAVLIQIRSVSEPIFTISVSVCSL